MRPGEVEPGVDAATVRRRWALLLEHRDELLAIARRRVDTREDAEDVVSTALLRTVQHPRLDERRIGAFLCTTVMRLAVDVHRDRSRQLAVGVREVSRDVPPTPFDEAVCDEAEARWLEGELAACPPREREVLQARVSGLSAQQASAHLGLTPKATENAYTRVRQRAHAALATTLAGVMVLVSFGRRLARPTLVAVPAAAVAAFALAVIQHAPEAVPPPAKATGEDTQDRGVTSSSRQPEQLERPEARNSAASPERPQEPRQEAVAPRPTRTDLTPPAVVDRKLVDTGPVYVEDRYDESFEASLVRCLEGTSKITMQDPLADPCA